jgi:putative ABC transport system permease protein
MNVLSQIWAVTAMNVRALPQRVGASLVTVIGVATVVAVMASLLAISAGLRQMVDRNTRPDDATVLASGAAATYMGSISRAAAAIITGAPGVKMGADGEPLAQPIAMVVVEVTRKNDGGTSNVVVEGIGPRWWSLNDHARLIAGRMYRPAVHELIAGRSLGAQYEGLGLGDHIMLQGTDWTVVGVFEDSGGLEGNALLGDADTVLSAFDRDSFQTINVRLETPATFSLFRDALTTNPQLSVEVKRTADYEHDQIKQITGILDFVGYFVGAVMAVGAVFGAVNTMYSAVDARTREIATLRAIGFGGTAVVISVLVEALLLAVPGALFGLGIAWLVFNGHAVTTLGLTFPLAVTPRMLGLAIIWAVAIGLIGGLAPSIRAARLPVATALRAT